MEDIYVPEAVHDTSMINDPYFALYALAALLVVAVIVRLFFTNTTREYVYNPTME